MNNSKRPPKFALLPGAIVYAVLFIGALIFTQSLRSPVSNMIFTFVLLLPLFLLGYTAIARPAVKLYMMTSATTTEKNAPFDYEFRLINESFLPFPFIDAFISLPQENSVRCADRLVKLSLGPFATYNMKNRVFFRFRGTYEIGVSYIYVKDFFRMFKMRVDFDLYETVYVLPRRLIFDREGTTAISDTSDTKSNRKNGYDRTEITDIRDYIAGDSLKSIHWKLSSKTQDLQVKDYNSGSSQKVLLYCDMSSRFPTEPPLAAVETVKEGKAEKSGKNKKSAEPGAAKKPKKSKKAAAEAKNAEEAKASEQVDVMRLISDEAYEDMNEFCADGVVELAVAAAIHELRKGNECTLLWFDRRSESGAFVFTLSSLEDFELIYKLFATAPLAPADDTLSRLTAMVSETQAISQLFVTSACDPAAIGDLCSMSVVTDAGSSFGSCEVILFNPEERFLYRAKRREYIDNCKARLAENGFAVHEGLPGAWTASGVI